VYWNCGLESYANRPKSEIQSSLKNSVATADCRPDYHYCKALPASHCLHVTSVATEQS